MDVGDVLDRSIAGYNEVLQSAITLIVAERIPVRSWFERLSRHIQVAYVKV